MFTLVRTLLTLALILAAASPALGSGFALYEWSARGNALGGALIGRADDPSALAFNPAGITQLEGTQVMAGISVINPRVDVVIGGNSNEGESHYWSPPHFYITQQLSDRYTMGLAVFSRFGLGTVFDDDWAGRYNSYDARLKNLTVNPNLAMKLTDELSLAVGVDVDWLAIDLNKKIDPTSGLASSLATDVDSRLTGDDWGLGFNAALHYVPLDWLKLGLTYRSRVEHKVDGEADFSRGAYPAALGLIGISPALYQALFFNDTNGTGKITLPDSAAFGVSVEPLEGLTLEGDVVWTHWSLYDKLEVQFDDAIAPGVTSSTSIKDWRDTWRFQFGAEYALYDWMDLRGSYVYDQSPADDEHADYLIPENNRHLIGGGVGLKQWGFTLDLSYTYLFMEGRHVDARPADGVLDSDFEDGRAHIYGVSLSYAF